MLWRTLPRLWPFLALFLLLVALCAPVLVFCLKLPELATVPPLHRLLLWAVFPAIAVVMLFMAVWTLKVHEVETAEAQRVKAEAAAAQARLDHEHYSLEVYGLGLELDHLTEQSAWAKLREQPPRSVILPTDPNDYPWSWREKGPPGASVYEAAIEPFPEKWELPFLLGGPALHNTEHDDDLKAGLAGARTGGGMHYHRFRTVSQTYDNDPDRLPAELFGLFDDYPDLPAAAIAVEDSMFMRNFYRPDHTPPLLMNGHEIPKITTSSTVILLGRRDRVDMLRPTAMDTPIPEIKIPFEALDMKDLEAVRTSRALEGRTATDYVLSYDDAPPEPQVSGPYGQIPFWEAGGGPSAAFKPSRFVKRPWCQEQLVVFDQLRIRARLHRPKTADYLKDGKPLGPRARELAFLEAWQAALGTLPGDQRPVRVIYDFGPKDATHMPPLLRAIHEAGPDLDLSGKDGIDVSASLRDTGAGSFYVALALGILATEKEGGVSAVVNLRRSDRATILMVSPPTAEDRVLRKIHFRSKYLGTVDQE